MPTDVATPQAPAEPTPLEPAPEVEESTTEDEVAAETPLAEGTEQPEPEQPGLPENWKDHPDIKAHRAEGYSEAQSHWQKQADLKAADLETSYNLKLRDGIAQAEASAGVKAVKEVLDAVREGFDTEEDAGRFIKKFVEQNADWAKVLNGAETKQAEEKGLNEGYRDASMALYEGLSDDGKKALDDYVRAEVNPLWSRGSMTIQDAFKAMREKRDDLMAKDIEAKVEKLVVERLEAENKAKAKSEEPEPLASVNGRGGAAMSFEDLEHIYATGEASPDQERQYRQMRRERGL